MELDYFVVDVFTGSALAGNPLAVVMNLAGLTAERMQAIAREFNLSETTFVERRPVAVEQAEGVRVRIFTTREELNFAGHPTLGTASVLWLHAPETVKRDTVTLALNVGAVPVRFAEKGCFGEMTQQDPEFGAELDSAVVARLTGLAQQDLHPELPPQLVSTETAFAIVPLRSHEALVTSSRGTLVLRVGANRRPIARVARPYAVLRRRGSGFRVGGRMRHQLSGTARRCSAGPVHTPAPGC
jgi:trans-2,3-dihydro-3-hydroxyanthranilate isomerase